jgi:hypothetical protein
VKLTTHQHLMPISRIVEQYLHSSIRLRGALLYYLPLTAQSFVVEKLVKGKVVPVLN